MNWKRFRTAGWAAAAVAALSVSAVLASAPTHEVAEASLPAAALRISHWDFDGQRGLRVQAGNQWYYAEFLGPCIGAGADRIAFEFNADGSLNRFSKIILPHRHQACAIRSFTAGVAPGAVGSG